jgi:hypothetical protein
MTKDGYYRILLTGEKSAVASADALLRLAGPEGASALLKRLETSEHAELDLVVFAILIRNTKTLPKAFRVRCVAAGS